MTKFAFRRAKKRFERYFERGKKYDAETDPLKKQKLKEKILRSYDSVTANVKALLNKVERRRRHSC